MKTYNQLRDLETFVVVGRALSFAKAARALRVPVSTVSRRLQSLEDSLGVRLMNRTSRNVVLTNEGQDYLGGAERLLEDARILNESVQRCGDIPEGLLRVSVFNGLATRHADWLTEFCLQYPQIELIIDTSPQYVDIVADRFDICIIEGVPPISNLICRTIGSFPFGIFASPTYLNEYGVPDHPRDLANHKCIVWSRNASSDQDAVWNFHNNEEQLAVKVGSTVRTDSVLLGIDLAACGLGIARGVGSGNRDFIESGKLVQLFRDWTADVHFITAVTATRALPKRSRIFLDFFATKMRNRCSAERGVAIPVA